MSHFTDRVVIYQAPNPTEIDRRRLAITYVDRKPLHQAYGPSEEIARARLAEIACEDGSRLAEFTQGAGDLV